VAEFSDVRDVRYTTRPPRRCTLLTRCRRLLPAVALLLPVVGLVTAVQRAAGEGADAAPSQEVDAAPSQEVGGKPAPEKPPEHRYTTPDQQFWYGFNLLHGRGVEKDPVEANVWFRKAAEQGQIRAQVHLGMAYMKGRGIASDPAQGVEWLTRAAERHHAKAQTEIGVAYFNGTGVRRDRVVGLKWIVLAAEGGGLAARAMAPEYLKRSTPEQREKARVLVREWRVAHGLRVPKRPEAEDAGPGS